MTTTLIRAVRVLGGDPADLLLEDGRIAAVGGRLSATGATVVDADGLVALPGLVDLHPHLREPGREDAETVETGSRAAALGGFTAVHAMANTDPVADSRSPTAAIRPSASSRSAGSPPSTRAPLMSVVVTRRLRAAGTGRPSAR